MSKPKNQNLTPHQPFVLKALRAGLRLLSVLAPAVAARLAYRLWFYPQRHQEPRRERVWRRAAKQNRIPHRDGHLVTYEWGDGPVVLLVHGWDGRANQMGAFAEPLAEAGYRAVSFDLPAHGQSSGKRTNMLEVAHAIADVAKPRLPLAGVVGHSLGAGAIARALADGLDTRAAILIAPPANLRWMADNYFRMLGLNQKIQERIVQILHADYGKTIWQDISPDHNLGRTGVPGLIIHDRNDRDVPFEQGLTLQRAWPRAQLIETEGLGHRRILRDPKVIATCIDFIRSAR